jgi:hypothetical protein
MDNCSWQLKFIHQEVSIYHLAKYTDIASVFIKPSYSKIFSLLSKISVTDTYFWPKGNTSSSQKPPTSIQIGPKLKTLGQLISAPHCHTAKF